MDNQNFNQPMPENSQIPPVMPEPKPKKKAWIVSGILGAVIIIALAVYFVLPKPGQEVLKKTFATYGEVPVNISPKVPSYTVSPDLSNIINAKDLYYYNFSPSSFSDKERNLLSKNAFVVRPDYHNEFFPLY